MKYALWIAQILLAVAFLAAGFLKLVMPIDQLAQNMAWVVDVPVWLVRFTGLVEVLGALGLILPAATRIQPQWTPLAAAGLALVMLFAAAFHLVRNEAPMMLPNLVLLLLAAFVAYGRWNLRPIPSRGSPAEATAAAR